MSGVALDSHPVKSGTAKAAGDNPGLAYWAHCVRGRERVEPEAFAQMVAHPGFGDACLDVIQSVLDLQQRDPQLMRVLVDTRRLVMAFFVVYLDARGGITLTAIRDVCRELGLASPGRATGLLISLRAYGYIERDPAQNDKRSRRYVPSAKIREAMVRNLNLWGMAFAKIEPEAMRVANRFGDRRIFNAYIIELAGGLIALIKRRDTSAVTLFAERNAGLEILYALVSSGQAGDVFPPRKSVPASSNSLAARFKVSRSHVGRLLRDAEKLGYLTRRDTTITLEEPLRRGIVEFLGAYFFGFASCACAALEAIGETP